MKKISKSFGECVFSIIYALIFFIIGLFYERYNTIVSFDKELFNVTSYIFVVFVIYWFHIIIHELGHLCFGMLTGYKFVSFRIGNFMIIKNEKISFKRFSLAGTLGQCLMAPPALKDNKIPYLLYNLGGSIFNFIFSIIFLIICFFVDNLLSRFILIIMIFMGFLIGLTNILPLKMSVNNDGYNALLLYKNPKSIYYFWLQLKINELLTKGVSLLEMDEKWFQMPKEEDLKDSLISYAAVMCCNRLLAKGDFDKTKENIEYLLNIETGIMDIHRYLLICDLIYCKLILGDLNINDLLSKELRKFMKTMVNFISVIRVEYAIACLYEKNEEKGVLLKKRFNKLSLTYPYKNDLLIEQKLMELVDNKIIIKI